MSDEVHIAVLQQRVDTIDVKIDDFGESLKSIANDVGAIRLSLAEHRGAYGAIRHATTFATGLVGAVAGYFGAKVH